ncbi:MAG TPA: sodium-translocating pyrophosphatase [Anaerolineaceae bacterium]|jgi:K(+)-stimulated pyrophosphate-energized sodium pump|nr:sodium-translocating pyrophosphatase [Anaerolineales bacterium]HOG58043.1 sodium-translocating pyrophosphatase [Anaerolineaceae bacterium]HOR84283.1 sodium-translocating pyrophosphatase [Anaerolineaceae bacterium]HPL42589.1 sodium-translocating pyrophosphatase [Anaerolineaceae bacterium]HPY33001.1 sodium-translocating pyrophosphatase [Anaerolineaceae bacterium]
MDYQIWLIVGIAGGAISIAVAVYLYFWVLRQDPGSEKAQQVAGWIRSGANTYLKRLYTALASLALVLGIIIALIFSFNFETIGTTGVQIQPGMGVVMAACFIIGALSSAVAGYMGMRVAVEANVRTATAAQKSLQQAFRLSFYAGAVLGLAMVGLAVIGMSLIFMLTKDSHAVLGFSFGASTLALLAKAGGGIYTKTADIAADLVGKVELGIPEDDPRNPAVVADNVGDNVGDVAGMGADIFDSYVASAVAVMILGASFASAMQYKYTVIPLILCTIGTFASLLGIEFVKVKEGGKPGAALNRGTIITCIIYVAALLILSFTKIIDAGIFWSATIGIVTGVIIGFTTDFFTNDQYKPVQETARVSTSGSAITIITGYSYGLISIVPSILGVVVATLLSYNVAVSNGLPGIYGIGVAAVGMLSISGMIVSADAYGPIVDNARGIAEMAGMGQDVIERADVLDSAGNTAKAITKGFSISAAALTVLALFAAYSEVVKANGIDLNISLREPMVIAGVFLGAMTPPLFSALLMLSVTHNAFDMIEEIRRQFHEKPGILAGTEDPDYDRCVGLAAHGALSSLLLPAFLAVGLPLVIGFLLGPNALGGFLGGAIFTGVIFALLMANAGGLWDNAKKFVETGKFGGPGSEAHKAAVVGDTVGDPFKDTAGPSLNTLITVMSLVASLFAPIIAVFHLF